MSPLTTHVLDTSLGLPARAVPVKLEVQHGADWKRLGDGKTDDDGRVKTLLPAGTRLEAGTYRLTFDTESYFRSTGASGFYPYVIVVFTVREAAAHLHVPLLLNPYGYSTYRGS